MINYKIKQGLLALFIVMLIAFILSMINITYANKKYSIELLRKHNSNKVTIFCDESKNIEYLLYEGNTYNSGGISIRRNIDGTISTCIK